MSQDTTRPKSGGTRDDNDTASHPLANKTHEAAEQVRHAARDKINAVQETVDSVKARAAQRVKDLGSTVHKIGEHMRVEDQAYIADRAERASKALDQVATYVESAELRTLIRDGERIARGQPLAFFGSAFVIGLGAGRLLKGMGSSAPTSRSSRRAQQDRPEYDQQLSSASASAASSRAARTTSGGYAGYDNPAAAPLSANGGGETRPPNRRPESERGAGR